MKYGLLKQIIGLLEAFEKEQDSSKIEDFTIWLNHKLFDKNEPSNGMGHEDLLISFKIMMIQKDLKKRSKAVLSNSLISSIDEYSFLLHLDHQESFRKMEIINLHHLEAPTGIEILKRLLKNDYIEEFPDPEDGRAKRVKITKAGIEELQKIKAQMDQIFMDLTQPLHLQERIYVSGMLDKIIHR
jgi:DNA-binding MarR family transcriptional regulator